MAKPLVPLSTTLSLVLRSELASAKKQLPSLKRYLLQAHTLLKPPLTDFSVALVGDKKMSDLHERFMNIPGPTDVLTFPLDEDARGRVTEGEVVVCVPEARRQAKAHGTQFEHELLLYALHGLLHLCGYDDRNKMAFAKMHRAEDRILNQLGIGPVFAKAQRSNMSKQIEKKTKRRPRLAGGLSR